MPEAATAPPPATPETPPPSNARPGGPNMAEAFAGFDALVTAPPDEKPPAETKPPADTKPSGETKPATLDAKPPTPDPNQPPAAGREKTATLREMLERKSTEAGEWKGKYEKLAAETKTPKPDPEKEQLLKDREAWNKQRGDLETELKFANYERSQEYKDKYQAPFLKAYEQGQKLLTALTVKEPDRTDEFGGLIEPGKTRKGTEADWDALMAITDEDTAGKFIAEHFGHNAARVTVLRDKVLDLHGQMRVAVEDYRKQSGERETQIRDFFSKQQKEVSDRWHTANSHAAEKFPQYFAPDAADPKGNALLEQGIRLTDLAFGVLDASEFSKLPQTIQAQLVNGRLPPAELTLLHSAIRNRSAAYDRLVSRLKQSDAEKKELSDKLAGYEKSEPGRGQTRKVESTAKTGVPSTFAEVDAAFDALAARNG